MLYERPLKASDAGFASMVAKPLCCRKGPRSLWLTETHGRAIFSVRQAILEANVGKPPLARRGKGVCGGHGGRDPKRSQAKWRFWVWPDQYQIVANWGGLVGFAAAGIALPTAPCSSAHKPDTVSTLRPRDPTQYSEQLAVAMLERGNMRGGARDASQSRVSCNFATSFVSPRGSSTIL